MIAALVALLLLSWLKAASASLGWLAVLRPLRRRGLSFIGRTEQGIFAIPLGMGMIAYLVLALGLLGQARPGAFWAVVGVAAVLTVVALVRGALTPLERAQRVEPPLSQAREGESEGKRDLLGLVAIVALGLVGLLTFVAALAPPGVMDWDALSYHLANPKTYLQNGRIFYLPWDHHSNFPSTVEMLFLLMMGLGSVAAAKLAHWLCGALLVASVFTFCRRHIRPADAGRRAGWIAALIVAGTPIVLWEASIAYADLATALFSWLSLYALVNAAEHLSSPYSVPPPPSEERAYIGGGAGGEGKRGRPTAGQAGGEGDKVGASGAGRESAAWLTVSALLMGFALGTKMTVLAFWGMLLLGILGWRVATTRTWSPKTIPHAALWGAIALAVGLPWYLKTYLYTGNPVYPFFYNLFGGRYWNAENAAGYAASQAAFGVGKTPIDLLLAPWQVTMEPLVAAALQRRFVFTEYVPFILSPALLALVLGAPLLLGRRRLSRPSVVLALFGGGVFVFWFFLMQQTRYLIPALPALAIVAAEALDAAWQERRRAVTAAGGLLVGASLVWAAYLEGTSLTAPALPYVTGQQTEAEYIARRGPERLGVAEQWINDNTPPTAGVALFDETRGYYLDRPYLWATPNHAYGLLPWDDYKGVDDWLADFKKRGYTTLLVNELQSPAEDDGQRWRSLLAQALAEGKVNLAFQVPNARFTGPDGTEEFRFVKVYTIP